MLQYVTATNLEPSTTVSDMEDVESIRENAPNWFRMGSRLITSQDFRQYIMANYNSEIYDILVMNNWEYMEIGRAHV